MFDVWMVKIKRPNRQRAPGHLVVLHRSVSSRFDGHSVPPYSGCWTTSLLLVLVASPQVAEHWFHSVHSPTLQSTGNVKHCIGGILNNADCIYNVFKWHKRDVEQWCFKGMNCIVWKIRFKSFVRCSLGQWTTALCVGTLFLGHCTKCFPKIYNTRSLGAPIR